MINGASRLSFPWWYSFVKWLLPVGLGGATALWVGLSLLGVIPIPAAFGIAAWAPVFFSQLDKAVAVGVFIAATGFVGSAIGIMTSFVTRGILLSVAERVAEHRAIHIEYSDRAAQVKESEYVVKLHERDAAVVEEGERNAELAKKYSELVGWVQGWYKQPSASQEELEQAVERQTKVLRFATPPGTPTEIPLVHIVNADGNLGEDPPPNRPGLG